MKEFFNVFLTEPLYNTLVFILGVVPYADLGVAVVILTIIVRTILFPLSKNMINTQIKMKKIQGKLNEIKEKYKDDRQKQALEMMNLYRENDIKPFSGILLLFLQLPIIFALYHIFLDNKFPEIKTEMLYSFISVPESVSTMFLGFLDITQKSLFVALLVVITQVIQSKISFASNKNQPAQTGIGAEIMKSMQIQMTYVLPIVIGSVAYGLGGLIAIYFLTGNIYSIFQQLYFKRKIDEHDKKETVVVSQ